MGSKARMDTPSLGREPRTSHMWSGYPTGPLKPYLMNATNNTSESDVMNYDFQWKKNLPQYQMLQYEFFVLIAFNSIEILDHV